MNKDLGRRQRIELLDEANQGNWDFGQWIVSLAEGAGDYLTRIVGEKAAAAGLTEMFRPVAVAAGYDSKDLLWREVLEGAMPDVYYLWPIAEELNELTAYAVYGILLRDGLPANERLDHINRMVADGTAFLEASPLAMWKLTEKPNDIHLARVVKLAVNRLALDAGEPIEPQALAEFGGISEGRVRNMMSGSDRKFGNENGRVPAADALAWLMDRSAFFNSIWKEEEAPDVLDPVGPDSTVLFLPVGRDGTPFHPGLARSGRFTIGVKGEETQITDFSEALDMLQHMEAPSWRRPNEVGNWGIIRLAEWKRFTSTEIAFFANNPNYRVPMRDRSVD